ncbi:MAG: DUF1259 domain-containing protein [Acidobacteriota bacterium]|nr:DUF1259 domain-containing protein [Acidobacteriota bacterium]
MLKRLLILFLVWGVPAAAIAQGLDTAKIDKAFGRSGQKTDGVYKVGFPRTDLHVVIRGVPLKPGLALGSWAAFSGSDARATVMGDLVLLQDEVNPVMQKLRGAGFEITALHNHLLNETPRLMYMHYMAHGSAVQLAAALRAALAVSRTPLGKPAAAPTAASGRPAWVNSVEEGMARKGNFAGGVLSFGIPRADAISMDGTTLSPLQGVAESINFQEASNGGVASTGDFVLTAAEVNPVISVLEEHHITVTALHTHMLTEEPRLFFMHFWVVGTAKSVAGGISAALQKISTK